MDLSLYLPGAHDGKGRGASPRASRASVDLPPLDMTEFAEVPAWPGEIDAGTVSPLPTARSARAYHVEGAAPADKEAIDAFQMAQYAGGAWGGDDLLELFADYVYDGENDGASGFAGGRETLSLKEAPSPFGLRAAVNGMDPPVDAAATMSPSVSANSDSSYEPGDMFVPNYALSPDVDGGVFVRDTDTYATSKRAKPAAPARPRALALAPAAGVAKPRPASRPRPRAPSPALPVPVSFKWVAPSRSKDRPLQGNAKSNATVLLTGCRYDISVNSLLLEDNALFEGMVPPAVIANGLTLAHPPRLFLAATLLCLLDGISDEDLIANYGLKDIPRMRQGHPLDKGIMKRLFPRRKKGTTKYELSEGIEALFRERNVAWPALTITEADAQYLLDKYGK